MSWVRNQMERTLNACFRKPQWFSSVESIDKIFQDTKFVNRLLLRTPSTEKTIMKKMDNNDDNVKSKMEVTPPHSNLGIASNIMHIQQPNRQRLPKTKFESLEKLSCNVRNKKIKLDPDQEQLTEFSNFETAVEPQTLRIENVKTEEDKDGTTIHEETILVSLGLQSQLTTHPVFEPAETKDLVTPLPIRIEAAFLLLDHSYCLLPPQSNQNIVPLPLPPMIETVTNCEISSVASASTAIAENFSTEVVSKSNTDLDISIASEMNLDDAVELQKILLVDYTEIRNEIAADGIFQNSWLMENLLDEILVHSP